MRPSPPAFFNSILLREVAQDRVAEVLARDRACTAYVGPPEGGWTAVFDARCCDAPGVTTVFPPSVDPWKEPGRAARAEEAVRVGAHLCKQLGTTGLLHVSPTGTAGKRLHCLTPKGELTLLAPGDDGEGGTGAEANHSLMDTATFVGSVNDLFCLGWSAPLVLGTAHVMSHSGYSPLLQCALRLPPWSCAGFPTIARRIHQGLPLHTRVSWPRGMPEEIPDLRSDPWDDWLVDFLLVRDGRIGLATSEDCLRGETAISDSEQTSAGFQVQMARATYLLGAPEGMIQRGGPSLGIFEDDSVEWRGRSLPDASMYFTSVLLFGTTREEVAALLARDSTRAACVSPTYDKWTEIVDAAMSPPVNASLFDSANSLDALGEEAVRLAAHLCVNLGVPAVLSPAHGAGVHLYCLTSQGELRPLRYPDTVGLAGEDAQTLTAWERMIGSVRDLFPSGWSDALVNATAHVFTRYPAWRLLYLWDALRFPRPGIR
jgi:hypothetical protein